MNASGWTMVAYALAGALMWGYALRLWAGLRSVPRRKGQGN